jgi:predicted  nucleic acid-binding Zn ribbon protein
MIIVELTFCSRNKPTEETDEAMWDSLGCLYKNGQIFREYVVAKKKNGYSAFVELPEKTSLKKVNNNKWVNQSYKILNKLGIKMSATKLISEVEFNGTCCCCKSPKGYILYTDFLDNQTPLMCGDCWSVVPLYRIPPTYDESEFYDLLQWQKDYIACDGLQMNCQTGERFGLREMTAINSSLTKRGRELCDKIKKSTGRPTFYYLYRPSGRSAAAELKRKCPSCKNNWALQEALHEKFDFRCDDCCLLSNIALNLR